MRHVESTVHTGMAAAKAVAAACVTSATGLVMGAVADVQSGVRPAAAQIDCSVSAVARPTAQLTDGNAVGGATVATPAAASTAKCAHGHGTCTRRTDTATPAVLSKYEPFGFSV